MKKILFAFIALTAVMSVQAQSLCGSWRSMQPDVATEEDGTMMIQNLTYTFSEDGTYSMVDELTISTEPAPTMALEVATNIDVRGTYTLEGDKLTLTPNMDTYKYEVLSISMNGKVADNPMVKSAINKMLGSPDFKGQFGEVETITVKVGESSLEMSNGEHTLNFMRFATIQN